MTFSSPLLGCRLIEVNGRNVYRLQEREVIHILQKAKDTLVVVVLRDLDSVPMKEDEIKTEELESLRDNLSLAMLEVETTQQENKDLNGEMERYVLHTHVGILLRPVDPRSQILAFPWKRKASLLPKTGLG